MRPSSTGGSARQPVYLVITIDTEEDNWGEYDRPEFSVQNTTRVPPLQAIFNERGVRPTYLISYPVATDSRSIQLLGTYREQGLCEIGSHPHPWNTPPVREALTAHNSYISHLPAELQYLKLETLHRTITANFGMAPTAYRSGRWAFSDTVARHLMRLGYAVDTSISPASDWRPFGGPDYSACSLDPFTYFLDETSGEPCASLLEVPATIDFVQTPRPLASHAYWSIGRRLPHGQMIVAALSKARVLNHAAISPETDDAPQMIRLARSLMRRGVRVINMFFHSPSLLPRCSPFVRSEADAASFRERIATFLDFAQQAGMQPVTLSELRPEAVGATRIIRLAADEPAHAACASA